MADKRFNPGRLGDMLAVDLYATGSKGERLKQKRERTVKWLHKKGKDNPDCLKLAEKLEDCRRKHRCQSGACPECGYAAQHLVARATHRFLKSVNDGKVVVGATIVPADGLTRRGRLDEAAHFRSIRRWKEKLGSTDIPFFVGATDWSFNEHSERRYRSRWSEHLYGFTITNNPEKLKSALKKLFPRTDSIPRPVKLKVWDGSRKATRYVLKPNFWRRVATDQAERFDKKSGQTRSCRATQKERLRSREKRELLLHIDKIGMQGRLIMRFCQLVNLEGTTPTIVLRKPKAVAAKKRRRP
jgi:hypothetical protein